MSIYRRFPFRNQPSFITTNTHNRQRILVGTPSCEDLLNTIYAVRAELSFLLLAFAVMPDHFHLVLLPPEEGSGKIMQLIKGRFRLYNSRTGRTGAVWHSRYHERILATEVATENAIEYVHNNPVSANLADAPERYRWSSANPRWEVDTEKFFGQADA